MADMVTLETYRKMERRKDKRIEELSKENAELKKRLVFARAEFQRQYKENAELKEKYVKNICDCDICDTYCNSQLANANLLLKDVYKIAMDDWNDPKWHDQVLRKAREYLKEIEK